MANAHGRTIEPSTRRFFLKALDFSSPDERAAFLAQAYNRDEDPRRQITAKVKADGVSDIENVHNKKSERRGGQQQRGQGDDNIAVPATSAEDLLAIGREHRCFESMNAAERHSADAAFRTSECGRTCATQSMCD